MPRGRGRKANKSRKCAVHNLFLARDGVCVRCVTEVQPTDRDVELDDVVNPPIPPDPPIGVEIAEVETTIMEMCEISEKCRRTSTDNYRLFNNGYSIIHLTFFRISIFFHCPGERWSTDTRVAKCSEMLLYFFGFAFSPFSMASDGLPIQG